MISSMVRQQKLTMCFWHLLNSALKKTDTHISRSIVYKGSRHWDVVTEPRRALVSVACQKLSHYIHFNCIKFFHPAPQELHQSAALAMMPRGSADAVKCAVKMLGRIPTSRLINRVFFFFPHNPPPFRSLHCGELTQVNFIIRTSFGVL